MSNWIEFSKLTQWCDDMGIVSGFQYDAISNSDIDAAIKDTENLKMVDPLCDWEDDQWLRDQTSIPEDQKHAYRVAAMVAEILSGGCIKNAIELDTFSMQNCCSCIPNGHHRIRAMQYLGMTSGPFSLSGHLDLLEELVQIGGVKCPKEYRKYVTDELTNQTKTDVPLPRKRRQKKSEMANSC